MPGPKSFRTILRRERRIFALEPKAKIDTTKEEETKSRKENTNANSNSVGQKTRL